MIPFLLLLLGITGLLWGTHLVIGNATLIARRFGWSDFVIGIVILAIGTDLPELVVAVNAALKSLGGQDFAPIIIGNSLGSCFGQLVFSLGVAGLFARLTTSRENIRRHGSVAVTSLVLLYLLGMDGSISRLDGVLLVLAFAAYLALVMRDGSSEDEVDIPGHILGIALFWLVLGLVVLALGADMAVDSVTELAYRWQISEAVISIVILGMGTSLPELSLALAAIFQKRTQLTIGNLVGSNIFDTLVPIGVAAVIAPLNFKQNFLAFDIPILFFVTVLALALLGIKPGLVRHRAALLVFIYIAYASYRTSL
jgi:cation:H+ antiporter